MNDSNPYEAPVEYADPVAEEVRQQSDVPHDPVFKHWPVWFGVVPFGLTGGAIVAEGFFGFPLMGNLFAAVFFAYLIGLAIVNICLSKD